MTVLKTIGAILIVMLFAGVALVKYALRQGMHVPTNDEIIFSSKAYIEAKKNPKVIEEKKGPVKASNIKKLKREVE